MSVHSRRPWTFTLINIHTDPDVAEQEVNVLDDVIRRLQSAGVDDDVILLGDLNVSERHFGDLLVMPNLMWTVTREPTNTRRSQTYDNIVFSGIATSEFSGVAGVIDLQAEYELTLDEALQVSDHLPVWAGLRRSKPRPIGL